MPTSSGCIRAAVPVQWCTGVWHASVQLYKKESIARQLYGTVTNLAPNRLLAHKVRMAIRPLSVQKVINLR